MKKEIKVLYYLSVVISALVGLWHFFVPWMFHWYDYLPMQYENLIVGIDYTNYCFSLLLFGLSVILILLGKRALAMNREVICFYFFLTVVWIFRACLASFIEPWPLQPIPAAAQACLSLGDPIFFAESGTGGALGARGVCRSWLCDASIESSGCAAFPPGTFGIDIASAFAMEAVPEVVEA